MNNRVIVWVIIVLVVIVGLWWMNSSDQIDVADNPSSTPSPEVLDEDAEIVGFQFINDVILMAPPAPDQEVLERIYNVLSTSAQERVSEETLSSDIASFVGIEDVPDQGASVEDLQIFEGGEAALRVGLNYSGGVVYKDINLVVEEGVWKVDSVSGVE